DYPGDPLVLRRIRIGAHQQLLVVGDLREAGPDLLSGDDQIVAVDHRARRQAGEVGAGTGLGKALTPDDLAAQNFRQVKRLLLLAAAGYQRRAAVVETDEQRRRVVRARAGELLVPDELLHQRRAAAAVRLRPRYSRVARVVELALPRQIEGGAGAQVMLGRLALRRMLGEPGACLLAEALLGGSKRDVHSRPCYRGQASRRKPTVGRIDAT